MSKKHQSINLAEAERRYRKNKGDINLGRAIGVAYFLAEKFDLAEKVFHEIQSHQQATYDDRKRYAMAVANTHQFRRGYELLIPLREESPEDKEVLNALIIVCGYLKKDDEGMALSMEYITRYPTDPRSYLGLGNILFENKKFKEAVIAYQTCIDLGGDMPAAYQNIASCHWLMGNTEDAIVGYRHGVAKFPNNTNMKFHLSHPLLFKGDLEEGWRYYDLGFLPSGLGRTPLRTFKAPIWAPGRDQQGTLLVWGEQGIGDQIMFASCLPDLINQHSGQITLELAPKLVSLFSRSFPSITVRNPTGVKAKGGAVLHSDEWFDGQVPIGSLSRHYRKTTADFARTPMRYIVPDPKLVQIYSRRFTSDSRLLKVGICWRSGLVTALRSGGYSTLLAMREILTLPNLVLVNLQYGDCALEVEEVQSALGVAINNWPDVDLKDDQESVAAIISNLDLVISAGTAVAQLAGALGVPTWIFGAGTPWTACGHVANQDPWHPSVTRFIAKAEEELSGQFTLMAERIKKRTPL